MSHKRNHLAADHYNADGEFIGATPTAATSTDHQTHINVYRHAARRTRGVIAECSTCGWTGDMRVSSRTDLALADANEHVRAHRPRKTRRKKR